MSAQQHKAVAPAYTIGFERKGFSCFLFVIEGSGFCSGVFFLFS